jgi:hypothetical protein
MVLCPGTASNSHQTYATKYAFDINGCKSFAAEQGLKFVKYVPSPAPHCMNIVQKKIASSEILVAANTSQGPLDTFQLKSLNDEIQDLKNRVDSVAASNAALETKIPEIALSGIDIVTDHSDPVQPKAQLGCDRVGGKLVGGSCMGENLSAGQTAVGPL